MMLGIAPIWTAFSVKLTVPDTGCPAQELRLVLAARSASEQLVSGTIWYDDLRRIERVKESPQSH
jgi:hypothetical protein